MKNNTINKPFRQRKSSRSQLLEAVQIECTNEVNKLTKEKEEAGYRDYAWEAFLDIVPDNSLDSSKRSQIIELQDKYKELVEHQEFLRTEDNIIAEFNKIHAIVRVDQTYILTEKNNPLGGKDFSLESRQSFRAYYEDETIIGFDQQEKSKADIWLKSPKRRKYKGITFNPTTTESVDGYYNLWKGFAKSPIKGTCQKYWTHVRENICNGNEDEYRYLCRWVAIVFQHPDMVHTAIVLRGSQGVGKNSFVDPLGILLGAHYSPLSSISELVSNFNYHLKNAVLIHGNEALWGGNKKEIGTIKSMITEKACLIEGKGKDRIVVTNFKHVILSSNENWPVHLDPDDRRFFVLNVSEAHKEDTEYFAAIHEELNNGGYEALLYDLLNEDLTNFDPRKIPYNSNSFSIKLRSAESVQRYLYEALCEGGFSIGTDSADENPVWQSPLSRKIVYKDYFDWCNKNSELVKSREFFGEVIKKIIPSVEVVRPSGGNRERCYKFLSLKGVREDFCKSFKEKPEQIFDNSEGIIDMVQ